MDSGPLLLALALIVLVGAFVARPFFERAAATQLAATNDLLTQREAILTELRELDFDHTTGKIFDDDYQMQRARLVSKGTEILKALDQLPTTQPEPPIADLDQEIERLIAARRAMQPAKPSKPACPQCHKPLRPADKFCPNCGAKIS